MKTAIRRLKELLGSQARVAAALGVSPEHVSRMMHGNRDVPVYVDAIVELLEALPPKDWPERWRT